MENYVVSARKYRPASFKEVIGQEAITSTLKNAIKNDQLAQSFLFCGPRGVGKTTCARIMAQTINCQAITDLIDNQSSPHKTLLIPAIAAAITISDPNLGIIASNKISE